MERKAKAIYTFCLRLTTQWGNRKDIHFLLKVDNSIGEKKSITWGETQPR